MSIQLRHIERRKLYFYYKSVVSLQRNSAQSPVRSWPREKRRLTNSELSNFLLQVISVNRFLHQQQLELKWKLFVKASLFFSQFFSQLWHNIPQRARKPHLRGNFFLIGKTSPAEWSPVRHEALKSHAERKTNELLFPVYIWLTEKMCIYYGSSNHRLLNMSSTTTTTCNIWK